ncbi:alcohol dehydrogenase, propanol-preferring [Dyadobacter soli]|uniref:Alcohol dehydrogenase, propanol-preferring n=1 Tax=Dyadobacter soli TaxID=659014 RepID=A0A1G7M3Y3_9BACT|nr:zinc-dependent alcohol dehydrogenase family protein [Dyadobacter soli]SDF55859.1 alcohol dehydrogenase, propanol-preferring [Dyadobacter soli]
MNLPATMRAMVLSKPGEPLNHLIVPVPKPGTGQVLIKVAACSVCRTDLHIVDGELKGAMLPLTPGHEIMGTVVEIGKGVTKLKIAEMVGIPWLARTCGKCKYCLTGRENLCDQALFTGFSVNGGYCQYTVAFEHYCIPLPAYYHHPWAAPLLCAGLIGYRSYRMLGRNSEKIGIYGFGAAAHILIQIAGFQNKKVYAFSKKGDSAAQLLAKELGAVWAGDCSQPAPEELDGAIIFAPVGELICKALSDIEKGSTVVCGGIHMSDIPGFEYRLLWGERVVRSVANLTVKDGQEYFQLAMRVPLKTQVQFYKLSQANQALGDLREGRVYGAAVLVMDEQGE